MPIGENKLQPTLDIPSKNYLLQNTGCDQGENF